MSCPIVLPHRPAVNNLSITDCEPLVRRLVLAPYSATQHVNADNGPPLIYIYICVCVWQLITIRCDFDVFLPAIWFFPDTSNISAIWLIRLIYWYFVPSNNVATSSYIFNNSQMQPKCVPVAQWLEHCASSAKVVGSIPREHMYWQKKL